jgi:tetratricopeptide (TPR) repeat protein
MCWNGGGGGAPRRCFFCKKIFFLLLVIVLVGGCASKRYAKKGAAFEQAGYYEKAAEMYYMSVLKNTNNVEATIGLKKNGQLTLDKMLGEFLNYYNADVQKDAVYRYLESKAYFEKLGGLGVSLIFPAHYTEYYNEMENGYLEKRYNEAYLLLEEESFAQSEAIFKEIINIDPNYQDVANLFKTAHYEPLYRKGKEYLTVKKYRTAYNTFQQILTKELNYKDAKELSDESLNNALITIAIVDFSNNTSAKNVETLLQSQVEKKMNEMNSPFIKLIDSKNAERIKSEQLLSLEGNVNNKVSVQAGKMYGVKALLTGSVKQYHIVNGKLNKTQMKGYLKEKITEKVNGQEKTKDLFHKTNYYEYNQQRSVSCTFQYKLISAETGELLVTDAIDITASDAIHYAHFDGNERNLIPGYWESKDKDSTNDVVKDNVSDKKELAGLLTGRIQIKSWDVLKQEVNQSIAQKVAQKIKAYDPEN